MLRAHSFGNSFQGKGVTLRQVCNKRESTKITLTVGFIRQLFRTPGKNNESETWNFLVPQTGYERKVVVSNYHFHLRYHR